MFWKRAPVMVPSTFKCKRIQRSIKKISERNEMSLIVFSYILRGLNFCLTAKLVQYFEVT